MNGNNNIKPWFTEEIKTLAKEKKEAYLQYRRNRSQYEHNKYKEVRNRVNNEKSEKGYWKKFSRDMKHNLYRGQKKIWRMLRNRKKPINEEVQRNTITPETWIAHFRNL